MENRSNARRVFGTPRGEPSDVTQTRTKSHLDNAKEIVQEGTDSLGNLVSGIVEDLQHIVRGEVQLAKTELKEEAGQMGKGAGMAVAGALVGLVGFIFLMLGVTYVLNMWMRMWIAAGVVGLALIVIAVILVMLGKSAIQDASLTPEKTIDSLKEDQEWASRQMKSVTK